MKPLKSYYNNEIEKWLNHPQNKNRHITQFQISKLFGSAYKKAATIPNVKNGFRATGILTHDSNIFQDTDFLMEEK